MTPPRLAPLALTALFASGCTGCGAHGRDTSHDACPGAAPALAPGPRALSTVFVVVLENEDWSAVKGSPSAPYLNGTLLPRYAHAEGYRNGGVHPSLPNYIALEAGNPLGVTFDADATQVRLPVACHLTSWLRDLGIPWKAYVEGIDGKSCPVKDAGRYAARHDPFVYFDDVTGSYCTEHVRPYGELAADLAAGAAPRYAFIVPDLCHDGHDRCPPQDDQVAQADAFLAGALPPILASSAWRQGGVVFVTWDEPAKGDAPIGLVAVSPLARPGYASPLAFSHASTVRSIEEILGVTPLLRDAAGAPDLGDLFTAFP